MLVYLMVDRKQESLTWVNTMNESPNHYNFIDRCVISYLTRHFNLDFQSVTSRKELHGSFFSVFCIQKVVPFWKLWTTLWTSWWYCFLHIFSFVHYILHVLWYFQSQTFIRNWLIPSSSSLQLSYICCLPLKSGMVIRLGSE